MLKGVKPFLFLAAFMPAAIAAGPSQLRAADIEEAPAADVRLAQKAKRQCMDVCISSCRAAQSACSASGADSSGCRTQFQICARRCVVSCNSR